MTSERNWSNFFDRSRLRECVLAGVVHTVLTTDEMREFDAWCIKQPCYTSMRIFEAVLRAMRIDAAAESDGALRQVVEAAENVLTEERILHEEVSDWLTGCLERRRQRLEEEVAALEAKDAAK